MVNLTDPGARLDVRIVFEASSPEFCAILRRHDVQLADIAISVISTKRVDELDSELDRNRLKRELADAVSQRLRSDTAHIANVYFTRFYYDTD
jgi:flagellar basal body-associated protein FliL